MNTEREKFEVIAAAVEAGEGDMREHARALVAEVRRLHLLPRVFTLKPVASRMAEAWIEGAHKESDPDFPEE